MTEITRVPLQPIKKGSLTKLWLGVVIAVLLAGGLAWAAAPQMLKVDTLVEGTGRAPEMGDVVFIKYVGSLDDGTQFDRSRPLQIPPGFFPEGTPMLLEEGALIPGFMKGILRMEKGGKYRLTIPGEEAYGAEPPPGSPIPPNADLTFEVEVIDILSRAEFDAKAQQLQAMLGAMQGQQAPGAAPQTE